MKKNTVLFIVFMLLIALLFFNACSKKTTEPEKQVEKPTFSPPAGTYTTPQEVSISCATEDAIIKYTIDGTEPGENSLVYVSPIQIESGKTLIAKAFKSGWTDSDAVIADYNITGMVATPIFDPPAGSYNIPQNVTISCFTENAEIYYTTDGSEPSETSSLYTAPIEINANTNLKARAFKNEWDESDISTAEYTFTVISPTFAPPAGIYYIPQIVTISCITEDALMYYTTDGSEPNETSSLYTNPIEVSTIVLIKAKAYKSNWIDSQVTIAQYAIDGATGTATDIDGNVYQTLVIGNQEWLVENLKVTYYRNGDPIPNITDNSEWTEFSTGAYCFYDNSAFNSEIYGALYNWYAVYDARGLAPQGWRVPSDNDIKQLEMYLGMSESEANDTGGRGTNEGCKLAGGYDLWQNGDLRNNSEFDTSGFSFLPGGYRYYFNGVFFSLGDRSYIWSSSESSISNAWDRYLHSHTTSVYRDNHDKRFGFSVRCVKVID